MADDSKYPTRIAPYGLRMPPDLKDRVESAAKANNRSMNAEIVATLEEKYPLPSLDLRTVTDFLDSLPPGFTDEEGYAERVNYIKAINFLLSTLPKPYTITEELGAITFYPFKTKPSELAKTEKEKLKLIETLKKNFLPSLSEENAKILFERFEEPERTGSTNSKKNPK